MTTQREIDSPIRVALESLKDTAVIYALIADVITFVGVAVLLGTRFAPLWPYAAILIIVLLLITLVAILIALGRVVVATRRSISDLKVQNQDLRDKLVARVDRRVLIEAQLKNEFKEALQRCNDCDKLCSECGDFFDFLRDTVFTCLVKEFGFARVGLSVVDEISNSFDFLFAYPAEAKGQKHLAEFDAQAWYIIKKGDTLEIKDVSYGKDFIAYFLPIQDEGDQHETIEGNRWFVFSFYVERSQELAQQELDYLNRELADELRNAIKWIRGQEMRRFLAQDVKHSHLCAVLYRKPDGQVAIDRSCDVLPESEATRVSKLLSQKENNRSLSLVFRRPTSEAEKPVIIPGGSYNVSLVPVLTNNRIHRVILFLDEAGGRTLTSDQTRWHSLYRLSNYLHQSVSDDEVTGLSNKWFFKRYAKNLVLYEGFLFALFIVSLDALNIAEIATGNYDRQLGHSADILGKWAIRGKSIDPLLARHEGGVFSMLIEVEDGNQPHHLAKAIKRHIEDEINEKADKFTVSIGVVVFRTPCENWGNMFLKGFANLQTAQQNQEGILVTVQEHAEEADSS